MPSETTPGQRMVYCIKLQKELPGLDEPPFDGELGQRIYNQVSAEAWRVWGEHCKMVLNEFRLNPANPHDQEIIIKHLQEFFFGEQAAAMPPGYVAPK
jgi:Fe-S cluster biosynthesis and repair protein YggX